MSLEFVQIASVGLTLYGDYPDGAFQGNLSVYNHAVAHIPAVVTTADRINTHGNLPSVRDGEYHILDVDNTNTGIVYERAEAVGEIVTTKAPPPQRPPEMPPAGNPWYCLWGLVCGGDSAPKPLPTATRVPEEADGAGSTIDNVGLNANSILVDTGMTTGINLGIPNENTGVVDIKRVIRQKDLPSKVSVELSKGVYATRNNNLWLYIKSGKDFEGWILLENLKWRKKPELIGALERTSLAITSPDGNLTITTQRSGEFIHFSAFEATTPTLEAKSFSEQNRAIEAFQSVGFEHYKAERIAHIMPLLKQAQERLRASGTPLDWKVLACFLGVEHNFKTDNPDNGWGPYQITEMWRPYNSPAYPAGHQNTDEEFIQASIFAAKIIWKHAEKAGVGDPNDLSESTQGPLAFYYNSANPEMTCPIDGQKYYGSYKRSGYVMNNYGGNTRMYVLKSNGEWVRMQERKDGYLKTLQKLRQAEQILNSN